MCFDMSSREGQMAQPESVSFPLMLKATSRKCSCSSRGLRILRCHTCDIGCNCKSHPWPGNFHMPRAWPKKKKKKVRFDVLSTKSIAFEAQMLTVPKKH